MKASDVKVLMQLIKETSQFALFSDKHLCLYPIENFNREKPLVSRRFDEQVKDLGSIPRGPLLLLCRGQTDLVYTLDKVKLEKLFVFVLPYESIKLSCSSSSLFAVLCSDSLSSSSSLHIYDCIGRIEQGSIEHPRRIVDFQFSYTNEHLIAAITNEETLIFDTRRRELLKSTAGHHRGNLSLAWNKVKDELYTSGMDRTIKVFNAELELIAKKPIFENVSLLHHFKLQAHSLLATAFYRNEAGVTVWELPDLNSALYNSRGEKDSKIVDFDIDPNSLCIVTLTHRGVSVSPLVLCEDSQKSAPNFACFAFDGRENFCASDQSPAFALFRVAGDPQKFSRSEKLADFLAELLDRSSDPSDKNLRALGKFFEDIRETKLSKICKRLLSLEILADELEPMGSIPGGRTTELAPTFELLVDAYTKLPPMVQKSQAGPPKPFYNKEEVVYGNKQGYESMVIELQPGVGKPFYTKDESFYINKQVYESLSIELQPDRPFARPIGYTQINDESPYSAFLAYELIQTVIDEGDLLGGFLLYVALKPKLVPSSDKDLGDLRKNSIHIERGPQAPREYTSLVDVWEANTVEFLQNMGLTILAARVAKISQSTIVGHCKESFTRVRLACTRCGDELLPERAGECPKCKRSPRCAICEQKVRGMLISCQECGHGGHFREMLQWFAKENENASCPRGCQHRCFTF